MRRPVLTICAAVVTVLALAGCSAAAGSGPGGGPGGSNSSGSDARAPFPADASSGGGSGSGAGPSKSSRADRSVVVTGELVVTAADPLAAADRAGSIVTAAGGRVDGRSEQAGSGGRAGTASLTLRIPAARLDATLAALKRLGHTDRVSTRSSDVTEQTEDVGARITALRSSIQRLLDLEQRATDTADLVKIETTIGDRQADLESLEAQQRGLADQVAMSTITMTLQPRGTVVATTPAGFGDGLATGWSSFVAVWGAALVGIGIALPWLVLVALLTGIVLGALALARHRERRPSIRPTRG